VDQSKYESLRTVLLQNTPSPSSLFFVAPGVGHCALMTGYTQLCINCGTQGEEKEGKVTTLREIAVQKVY